MAAIWRRQFLAQQLELNTEGCTSILVLPLTGEQILFLFLRVLRVLRGQLAECRTNWRRRRHRNLNVFPVVIF